MCKLKNSLTIGVCIFLNTGFSLVEAADSTSFIPPTVTPIARTIILAQGLTDYFRDGPDALTFNTSRQKCPNGTKAYFQLAYAGSHDTDKHTGSGTAYEIPISYSWDNATYNVTVSGYVTRLSTNSPIRVFWNLLCIPAP